MNEAFMRDYFERNQEMFYMRFRKDESSGHLKKSVRRQLILSEKNTFMAMLWKRILRQC